MFRLIVICAFLASVSALSDVHQSCIQTNTGDNSNNNILGSWFKVYKFTLFGGLTPSISCTEITFKKPTAAELQEYRDRYNTPDLPYSLDDNAVIMEEGGYYEGLIMGDKETKFYVLKPSSGMVLSGGYAVYVYRIIDDKYMLFWDCALRGSTRWLLSRDRNASVEEMEAVIKSRPEVNNMQTSRYCHVP